MHACTHAAGSSDKRPRLNTAIVRTHHNWTDNLLPLILTRRYLSVVCFLPMNLTENNY